VDVMEYAPTFRHRQERTRVRVRSVIVVVSVVISDDSILVIAANNGVFDVRCSLMTTRGCIGQKHSRVSRKNASLIRTTSIVLRVDSNLDENVLFLLTSSM